ncbi:uncharacterized protein LOC120298720 isoform X2 [Crotalus tigris]|uniref:uncharacterized protein LOC120298720 isoform X2 n=1 Tax=Crotalus tigris TaxID=88082 RepID=UPI00192F94DB|nr:uncharacterized protein LOC120298720 isoform X2 [Crotalus tigris]
MSWSERMATVFTLSTLFSLVFVIMDHKWIKFETEAQIYYSGLWKVCIKLVCPNLAASAPNLNGAKTLLIMALFSGFVGASFMSITYRYSTSSATYQYLVPAVGSFIAGFLGLVAHQHMLMHGAVLSDRDSGESVTSSIWSSASSSSQFWDEEEKDSKLQIARA